MNLLNFLDFAEAIINGILLGVFLIAYSHFRKASTKLEFLMAAIAVVTLLAFTQLSSFLVGLFIKVVIL